MTSTIIVVPELAVRVVTGDTCYRYETDFLRFMLRWVHKIPVLRSNYPKRKDGDGVTLRCAMLDMTGNITTLSVRSRGEKVCFTYRGDALSKVSGP